MEKVTWKSGTFEYPIPAVMVSVGDMNKSNIMTVAWTGIINTDPAMCYISVRKERYSYDIIKKNKEFVINLTTEELTYKTDWAGVRSGREYDKFAELKLTKVPGKFVKCPMIEESPVNLECKVTKELDLGSHVMFMAKIMAINVDARFIDKKGAFDISKCKLIAYANGGYYALGKKLGTFGYSVRKKSKAGNNKKKINSKKTAEKVSNKKKEKTRKTKNKSTSIKKRKA